MGKLTGGIDYDMIGRLGNHVGRKRKGKNIISMRPSKSKKPGTPLQINQRIKFGMMTSWLSNLSGLIDIGFAAYDTKMTAQNAAVKYNLEHAITGTGPDYQINYRKILYSRGPLDLPIYMEVGTVIDCKIEFLWANQIVNPGNPGESNALATDKATLLVYNSTKGKFVTLKAAAPRSALKFELQLPLDFAGDSVDCWMSFVSANGKLVSNSIYITKLLVL
ncbi:MAG: DUF6266 family protein [Candidatus Pedobacter colombiensis]|uniref:DUF6266 family protein n=1 Tax=Candidatus Pedobacter colombiensis TaxID=3121371 RepID=A0AAJ5WD60_9SPHI|nr:DUF6266 family protein [Pedobacter sp.]WEK20517.1 MAG: DUF6266 family protein [Pedobacter sp.]